MENTPTPTSNNNLVKVVIGLWAGVILGAVIIGILVWSGVLSLSSVTGTPLQVIEDAPLANIESGTQAPDAKLTGLDGGAVSLEDYRGKVVVMNFWATWCGPCVQEMPMFQAYQDDYPQMVLLGVDAGEDAETVKNFVARLQLSYPIVLDKDEGMGRALRISFLPTTIFIDESGEIRFRHYGVVSPEQMDYYLKTLKVIPE